MGAGSSGERRSPGGSCRRGLRPRSGRRIPGLDESGRASVSFPKAAFEDELAPKVRRSHPFVLASFSGIPADQEDVLLAEIEATDTEFLVAVTGSGTDLALRELGFPLLAETASHSVFSTMY